MQKRFPVIAFNLNICEATIFYLAANQQLAFSNHKLRFLTRKFYLSWKISRSKICLSPFIPRENQKPFWEALMYCMLLMAEAENAFRHQKQADSLPAMNRRKEKCVPTLPNRNVIGPLASQEFVKIIFAQNAQPNQLAMSQAARRNAKTIIAIRLTRRTRKWLPTRQHFMH